MEGQAISIHAIIIMTSTVIGAFFLFRHLMRRKRENRLNERMDQIEKDGVEFTAVEVGLGFDPKMVRKDGRMPCCLTTDWTNPETGKTHKLKSQWFWYDPRDEDNKVKFKDIQGKVIASDPTLCSMDISAYNLTPFLH